MGPTSGIAASGKNRQGVVAGDCATVPHDLRKISKLKQTTIAWQPHNTTDTTINPSLFFLQSLIKHPHGLFESVIFWASKPSELATQDDLKHEQHRVNKPSSCGVQPRVDQSALGSMAEIDGLIALIKGMPPSQSGIRTREVILYLRTTFASPSTGAQAYASFDGVK